MTHDSETVPAPGRRRVLQLLALSCAAAAALRSGIVAQARAAQQVLWPKDAFAQKSEAAALKALFGSDAQPARSDKISFDAPVIAENGAVVPVTVDTTLDNVTMIAFLIPANPFTLTAAYVIPQGTLPSVACRLKMAKTAKVIALVKSGDKLFFTDRVVKVTLGGCG